MTKFLTVEVSRKKYNEVNIEQYIEMQILHMLCNKHYSMYAIIHNYVNHHPTCILQIKLYIY